MFKFWPREIDAFINRFTDDLTDEVSVLGQKQ